jgi:hypothetical protein
MKRISEEWALDWYNTRGGRTIIKPKFGERITIKECLTPKVKDAPRKKIIQIKKKEISLKQFIKINYNRTYIEVGRETIILLRPLSVEGVKRLFPRAKSIYWENTKEESFSNIVKLK